MILILTWIYVVLNFIIIVLICRSVSWIRSIVSLSWVNKFIIFKWKLFSGSRYQLLLNSLLQNLFTFRTLFTDSGPYPAKFQEMKLWSILNCEGFKHFLVLQSELTPSNLGHLKVRIKLSWLALKMTSFHDQVSSSKEKLLLGSSIWNGAP